VSYPLIIRSNEHNEIKTISHKEHKELRGRAARKKNLFALIPFDFTQVFAVESSKKGRL